MTRSVRMATAVAIVLGLVAAGALVYLSNATRTPSPSPPPPLVNATVSINLSRAPDLLSPDFLGVNLRADSSINGTQGSAVAGSSVRFVRWPGGALADRYDPFGPNGTSTIYADNGTFVTAPSTPADFVSWCRALNCSAIVTVPGEINDPSLAAQEVRFFEDDLDFFPTYWEIGNEPGAWDHYSVPWNEWEPNQTLPPSPTQYAQLVHRYVAAMRSVDPTVRIIGLPGIGPSNESEAAWIKETVLVNGGNLSAVALHIYPAGSTTSNTSLASFLATLTGSNGLPTRVATARSAVTEACGNCSISVIADEVAAATGSNMPAFISGFPLVPYEATEAIQGIQLNVSSLVYWVADSGYSGSWVAPDGSPRPIYTLFTSVLDALPSARLASNLTADGEGLSVAALSTGVAASPVTLLIANANLTFGFQLGVPGALPSDSIVSVLTWDESTDAPVRTEIAASHLDTLYVPPLSVVRAEFNTSAVGTGPLKVGPGTVSQVPGMGPGPSREAGPYRPISEGATIPGPLLPGQRILMARAR